MITINIPFQQLEAFTRYNYSTNYNAEWFFGGDVFGACVLYILNFLNLVTVAIELPQHLAFSSKLCFPSDVILE